MSENAMVTKDQEDKKQNKQTNKSTNKNKKQKTCLNFDTLAIKFSNPG